MVGKNNESQAFCWSWIGVFLFLILVMACQSNTSQETSKETTAATNLPHTADLDKNIFVDDPRGNQNPAFTELLDSSLWKRPEKFLKNLLATYSPTLSSTNITLVLAEQQVLYGQKDSLWLLVCQLPIASDTTCLKAPQQQYYLFNSKGKLITQQLVHSVQWLPFAVDSMPLLLTSTHNCEGQGWHQVYRYEQGRLIDMLNAVLEWPNSVDLNETDGQVFAQGALKATLSDLNADGQADLLLEGYQLILKDANNRSYSIRRPYRRKKVQYTFLYRAVQEDFVWQE